MAKILLNYVARGKDIDDPAVRARLGSTAGSIGIACNLLLAVGKLLTGLAAGSMAILADAMNNFSDSASSIVTLLGFRLAQRPADQDHPYGHARYEYLAALAVSLMILVVGIELAKSSFQKILQPEPVVSTAVTFAVLGVSIAVKLWMAWFYRDVGKTIHSQVLFAASDDSRNDVAATGAVLLSCIVHALTHWNVDGVMGLAVAIFILRSGFQSARDTISPLLGRQADPKLVENLSQLVLSHDKVLGIHDLLIHDYGPGQCFASVHAEVSASENTLDAHDLLDDIEDDALAELNVHLVIHCDPVITDDPKWDRVQQKLLEAVEAVDPRLSVHDFHIMHNEGQTRIGFDLEVPYSMDVPRETLRAATEAALKEKGIHYPAEIQFDGKV